MGMLVTLGSCKKYLDQVPDSVAFSENQIFTDSAQSQKFIDQLLVPYTYFDDNDMFVTNANNGFFGKAVYGLREKISDNIIPNSQYNWIDGNSVRQGNNFYRASAAPYWNESAYDRFRDYWKAIRVANISIANVNRINGITPDIKAKILGEAYFLRGHFYFMILEAWGGMPWITAPLDPGQNMDLPRDSYTGTAQKIANTFDSASLYLPLVVNNADYNRPSKMAALAYKAKALMWAACPFANPGNNQKLWQDAAVATAQAIDVAEKSGYYHLVDFPNWRNMFIDVNEEALHEIIFGRFFQNFQYMTYGPYHIKPKSVAFGSNGTGCESATENLAQCFAWNNGEPVDPSTAEYKSNPYTGDGVTHTGRDPRMKLTLMYNGHTNSIVQKYNRTVEIWNESYNNVGAQELQVSGGNPVAGNTVTGYYNYKYLPDAAVTGGKSSTMWNYIRLADLYLFYAEAANRAWGPTASPQGINGFTLTAVQALNKIRLRANMPAYDNSKPWLTIGSADQFEKIVRNESRIETAYEEKRYYDLRRWNLLTDPATTGTMYGLYIKRTGPATFQYSVVTLPDNMQLKYQERHKLFPINPADTYLGPSFVQNPGW